MGSNRDFPAEARTPQHPRLHDYVSPGMASVVPDAAFPEMIVGNTISIEWPFLRRWVEHNWYTDRNDPTTGFANRDEAAILYNNALLFKGQSSLEIGCWRGWSAVHIALGIGTGALDLIDPILGDATIASQIRKSLAAAGVLDRIAFHTGFSPDAVDALAGETKTRWSFVFIDGNHDGDAPTRDAEAVMRHTADTAMVLFHDLASPHVAAGLRVMRDAGWNTMLYQTMQIMGIAWRGDVEPVQHQPDPGIFWTLPRHLHGFTVNGWTPPNFQKKAGWWHGMTMEDRRNVAVIRAQTLEDDLLEARSDLALMDGRLQAAHAETIRTKAYLDVATDRFHVEKAAADLLQAERDATLARAFAAESSLENLTRLIADLTVQVTKTNVEMAALLQVKEERDAFQAECYELLQRAENLEQKVDVLSTFRAAQEVRVQTLQSACQSLIDHNKAQIPVDAAILDLARWLAGRRVLAGLMRRTEEERIVVVRDRADNAGIGYMITDNVIVWTVRRRTIFDLLRRSASSAEALITCALLEGAKEKRRAMIEQIAASTADLTFNSGEALTKP